MNSEIIALELPKNLYVQLDSLATEENTDPVSMISHWVAMTRKYRRQQAEENEQADLIAWARQQMAQHAVESGASQDNDTFLGNMAVSAYFALPDAERERIWTQMYSTSIESTPEREEEVHRLLSLCDEAADMWEGSFDAGRDKKCRTEE